MTDDTRDWIRYGVAAVFLSGYVMLTGGTLYIYTAWLNLGDPLFGRGGWEFYWPIWTVAFAPCALCAVIAAWSELGSRSGCILLRWFFVGTFGAMNLSLLFDVDWWVLIIEWVVLGTAFFWIAAFYQEHKADCSR